MSHAATCVVVVRPGERLGAGGVVVKSAIDLFGELPLPLGVAGHEGSIVVVGLNGLRLLRSRAWTKRA